MNKLSQIIFLTVSAALLTMFLITNGAAQQQQQEKLKLEILNGHSTGVLSVAVSRDEKYALTGSTDWTALLWNLETGKQLRRFEGHEMHILSVSFSRDGQFVLTASSDQSARLWETATGKQKQIFKGHKGRVVSAAISADNKFIATAGDDTTARIWDAQTGKQLFEIPHARRVNSIAFSPDGRFLLTGGEDSVARLYETQKPDKPIRQFRGHTAEIKSVAYSPDGSRVLTGGDFTVRLWDSQTSAEVKKFEVDNSVLSVAFTPSGKSIAAGTDNTRSVYLWDVATRKTIRKIAERGFSVAATEKEVLIAGGDIWNDNTVPIYPIAEPQKQILSDKTITQLPERKRFLSGKSDSINDMAVSPDFRWIVAGAENDTSGLWNLASGEMTQWWKFQKKIEPVKEHPIEHKRISFESASPNYFQNNVRTAGNYAAATEEVISFLDCKAVVFAPDSSFFLYADETFIHGRYLNDETKSKFVNFGFKAHDKAVTSIAVAADGKSFVTASADGTARLWQGSDKPKIIFVGHQESITSVAYSPPDGKTIATAGADNTVRLWSTETGEIKRILKGFTTRVNDVQFSPDGKTLATASGIYTSNQDNIVRLWDAESGREIRRYGEQIGRELSGHVAGFKTLAFSPDGRFLIGGNYDGISYLWEIATGTEIRRYGIHPDSISSVQISADGRFVVTGSNDATTRIWNFETGKEICSLVTFLDGTWAVVERDTGRYDAPNGGEIDGIQWVLGNETIALNQLKDVYYTPNLLPRLLGYNKEPLRDVPDLARLKLFPKIVEQKVDAANAVLTVKLENRGGGIGEVLVKINGVQASADARNDSQKAKPDAQFADIVFSLKGSAGFDPKRQNEIEVVTNNYDAKLEKGYISSRGAKLFYNPQNERKLEPQTLYAVIGGVSNYVGDQIDLNFAAKDAEDFANALQLGAKNLFGAEKVKIKILSTSGKENTILPTKKNFENAFREIAQTAKPEDIFVVYLAGHGTSLNSKNSDVYYYLTQEADKLSRESLQNEDYRRAATISSEELLHWLTAREWKANQKGVQALKQIMILDTCAAGAAAEGLPLIAKRELSADQIKALERLKDRTGFHILMGSAADQSSYESSEYGQGLLTYALLEGIKGAAYKNKTSINVDTQILFNYAADRVPKMARAGGIQQPRIFGATSIDIGLMNNDDRKNITLEAVKPVFGTPFFFQTGKNIDSLKVIKEISRQLDAAGEPQRRGDGGKRGAALVFVDGGEFPDAFQLTGTYSVADENITLNAELRRDENIIFTFPPQTKPRAELNSLIQELIAAALIKANENLPKK